MFIDYHVHSEYSDDSIYPMEDVITDAIALGIDEICFSDHVDYGVKEDWNNKENGSSLGMYGLMNVNYPLYVKEIAYLQEKYKDNIGIKMGLEFGMQKHTIPQFQKLFDSYRFDFILLSVHQINNKDFWQKDYQQGKTDIESYYGYYEELLYLVNNYKDYSCLAHFDLMRRYLDNREDRFEECKDIIKEILTIVIQDGKGIEFNTSSKRYGLDGFTPSIKILELYHELGGTIITVGSDSHKKEHLGYGIHEAKQILKEIGFEYYCTYDQMKPIFHKL